MGENRGVNFAGWMVGVAIALAVVVPVLLTLLCCFGGALIGVTPSATP